MSQPLLRPSLWRRLGQCLFLALFLFLFIKTDYAGRDELPWAVNLFFRIDPFLALAAMLAVRMVIALMLPAALILLLTLLFGRFSCGWICPMGSMIDGSRLLLRSRMKVPNLPGWKYALLLTLLTASFCGLPVAGYLDPFSLLVRGLSFALHPAFGSATTSFFTWTYQHAPAWLNAITEPVYAVMKTHLLPFADKVYDLSVLSLFLLLTVLGLSVLESRFFCRSLCPLGALLAFLSRYSLFALAGGGEDCGKCRHCRDICRMGAIDEQRGISTAECILCLDCLSQCPRSRIHYGLRKNGSGMQATDLSRRGVITSLTVGALLPLVLPTRLLTRNADPLLIRPPGALAEADFLCRCVRCGECMKVCIGNALQPAWLEAGLEGIFTPRLIGRIGYCEYNCTLCGQVCPTGAIRRLSRDEKQRTAIGRAYFNKNRCLPYAAGVPCIVCEEHCPTPEKAIKFREAAVVNTRGEQVFVRQPYIAGELCIGCGICENRCPLDGGAAVIVTSEGASRGGGKIREGY
ncbi:MAG: 4Fe-4S binding protein [Desulfocapsaceae bacterium]|nr:4Fe-4S binding protein [Desulfocapsaceae bacterium]